MTITNKFTLLFILLIGTLLRFYNYLEIPYTHDEFSALFRTNYTQFWDLIKYGVMPDGHPAGIQVFLYFFISFFGEMAYLVKFPFLVSGILAIYFIYKVGSLWFNETVGLLSACFLATLQYPVLYSQIARPYITGLLFSLIAVYYWTLIMKNNQSKYQFYLFVISSVLCAYNHYFSLLFIAIVYYVGFLFIKKELIKKYIISGCVIFALYIPHIKIFFHHLSVGGVGGWLGPPENNFLLQYIYYIFHFSPILLLLIFLLCVFSFLYRKSNQNMYLYISIIFFFAPFLTGFIYSIYVNPVLQYSVLIFSFPYLLFILFSQIKLYSNKINFVIIILFVIINMSTLIINRQHYKLFYQSVYEEFVSDYSDFSDKYGDQLILISKKKKIINYLSKHDNTNVYFIEDWDSIKSFQDFLANHHHLYNKLYLGALSSIDPSCVPIIQQYFPLMELEKNYVQGSSFIYSKSDSLVKDRSTGLQYNSKSASWINLDSLTQLAKKDFVFRLDSLSLYSHSFTSSLEDLQISRNDFIDVSVKINLDNYENNPSVILVSELSSNNDKIYWTKSNSNDFYKDSLNNQITIYKSIKLSDIKHDINNTQFKTYIWNPEKLSLELADFIVKSRKGNPLLYALTQPL